MAKKQDLSDKKTKSAPRAKAKPSKVANTEAPAGAMTEDNKLTTSLKAPQQRGLSDEMIGSAAGDVWRVLSERGGQTLAGLKKSLDSPDDLVLLGLGWLAREGKLAFDTNGRTVTVSLR